LYDPRHSSPEGAVLTRLKYERLRRGISQTALAAAASVNQSDLGKIERGQYTPPTGSVVLARVARVLDTPVAELLRPVEIQNAAEAPRELPVPVPPIPHLEDGPAARQLQARRRCAAETAEAEAADHAEEATKAVK
jgi:transcriptional regulator with XRE-family HTH domain